MSNDYKVEVNESSMTGEEFSRVLSGTGSNTTSVYSNSLIGSPGGGIGNCITTIPSYGYAYTYPQYLPVSYEIQLRKLENGWVLLKGGKEYILKSPEDVIKYMKDAK